MKKPDSCFVTIGAIASLALPGGAAVLTTEAMIMGPGIFTSPIQVAPVPRLSVGIEVPDAPVEVDWRTTGTGFDPPVPVFGDIRNESGVIWEAFEVAVGSVLAGAFEAQAGVALSDPTLFGVGLTSATPIGPGRWVFNEIAWEPGTTGSLSLFVTVPGSFPGAATGSLGIEMIGVTPEPTTLGGVALASVVLLRRHRLRSHNGTP